MCGSRQRLVGFRSTGEQPEGNGLTERLRQAKQNTEGKRGSDEGRPIAFSGSQALTLPEEFLTHTHTLFWSYYKTQGVLMNKSYVTLQLPPRQKYLLYGLHCKASKGPCHNLIAGLDLPTIARNGSSYPSQYSFPEDLSMSLLMLGQRPSETMSHTLYKHPPSSVAISCP